MKLTLNTYRNLLRRIIYLAKKDYFCKQNLIRYTNCILTRVVSEDIIERKKNLLIEVGTIIQHTLENMRYKLNHQTIYSKLYHDGEATVN